MASFFLIQAHGSAELSKGKLGLYFFTAVDAVYPKSLILKHEHDYELLSQIFHKK